jgi:signal transduction histidine kinase
MGFFIGIDFRIFCVHFIFSMVAKFFKQAFFLLLLFLSTQIGLAQQLDSLKSVAKTVKNDSLKIETFMAIHDLLKLSDFTQAAKYADSAYALAKRTGSQLGIAKTGQFYGVALSLTGQADKAKEILNEVIQIADQLGEVKINAYSEMTLGNIENDLSNYAKALPHYYASRKLYESIDDYGGASGALIWIGIINQFGLRDYDRAIAVYKEASALAEKGRSKLNQGYIFANLATIYYEQSQYDSAISFIQKSNAIKEQYDDKRGLANGLEALGNCYFYMGIFDKSGDYYGQSLKMREVLADSTGIASAYINVGRVYGEQGEISKAFDAFSKGRAIAESVGYKEAIQQALLFESDYLEKSANYKDALQRFKAYKTVSDSMFNIASQEVLEELQIQYDTEKKEQQITLQEAQIIEQDLKLQRNQLLMFSLFVLLILLVVIIFFLRNRAKRNEQLIRQDAELKLREAELNAVINSQEKERNRFARDLHDGFGQLISVLKLNLSMLTDKEAQYPEKRMEVFKNGESVINDMYAELRSICFDLMPQTLIKKGLTLALKEFGERINQSKKVNCEVIVFTNQERLTEIIEISLFRISQEWVNNILKYGEAEEITIQLTRDEEELTLTIEDDGIGFDPKLFFEGKGNGWRNIQTRLNLIKGHFDLDSQLQRKGTMITVNVPYRIEQNVPTSTERQITA